MDVVDSVQKVVCLVNDDYIPFERNPHSFSSGSMQQCVVGHHDKLMGDGEERECRGYEDSKG